MNLQQKVTELTDAYDEICEWFNELDDNMVSDAFGLMKEASALQASFESLLADLNKSYIDCERMAKAKQAKVSRESSTKVNEGDRIAASSEDVLKSWEFVSDIQKSARYMEAKARHLSRIYFDSKLIYENACRSLRNPVGDDKLVGRI